MLEEEGKPASDREEGLAGQEAIDKPGLLCALWKIHQGLMMQEHAVKGLVNVFKGLSCM